MHGRARGVLAVVEVLDASLEDVLAAVVMLRAAEYQPAHRLSGDIPQPPVNAIGWVEAVVDLEVDAAGAVVTATGLRATPGGLDFVLPSLKNWKFQAANDGTSSVASHVLVAAMMRPAQLFDPAGGSPAADLQKPNDEVAYPRATVRAGYPRNVIGDRSVLVEVVVGSDGRVERAAVVGAASGFDSAALAAARGWSFRPARYQDQAVPGAVYLIFGFRTPPHMIEAVERAMRDFPAVRESIETVREVMAEWDSVTLIAGSNQHGNAGPGELAPPSLADRPSPPVLPFPDFDYHCTNFFAHGINAGLEFRF